MDVRAIRQHSRYQTAQPYTRRLAPPLEMRDLGSGQSRSTGPGVRGFAVLALVRLVDLGVDAGVVDGCEVDMVPLSVGDDGAGAMAKALRCQMPASPFQGRAGCRGGADPATSL